MLQLCYSLPSASSAQSVFKKRTCPKAWCCFDLETSLVALFGATTLESQSKRGHPEAAPSVARILTQCLAVSAGAEAAALAAESAASDIGTGRPGPILPSDRRFTYA